jgi:hypothetical protein
MPTATSVKPLIRFFSTVIFLPSQQSSQTALQQPEAAKKLSATHFQRASQCSCLTKSEPFLNGTNGALRAPN